ncbi:hypothetical protein FQN57_007024 [Myotisia sp. PD_48]|nr:hypothetical protein FQN57_007024 [Myotisia sp. PD_48]
MSMITATAWVRRGAAAQFPEKYEIDEEEINRISKLAQVQLENARSDLRAAREENESDEEEMKDVHEEAEGEVEAGEGSKKKGKGKEVKTDAKATDEDDVLKEYDMDHYDSDPVNEEGEEVTMFGNIQSLAYHQPHEKDPYLVLPENEDPDDSDNEREELQILTSDNLLLAGKVEDEVAHLEVYVYEDSADNLYVHHDIMLPAIPLCVEWLDMPVGTGTENRSHGNFVAVGTMEPDIEIWDLDVVDTMYPNAILGEGGQQQPDIEGESSDKKQKKKKSSSKKGKKSNKANDEYHVDSVLALAANRQHRNLLASASADQTVKLWDLNTARCAKSYQNHTDKICALDWHPKESTILLSGSYDRSVVAADMRTPEAKAARWRVASDVENVRWDPHDPNYFYITTDSGMLYCHDVRKAAADPDAAKPEWVLQAHDSSISSFDINPFVPGFLATGSTDKYVKLWSIQDNKPSMVVSRKLDVGKVFSSTFGPDQEVGFRLAVAGSKGVVQVWDTSTNGAVRRVFAGRMGDAVAREGEVAERMVGVAKDESDDSDGEEGEGGKDGWESMEED